MSGRSSPLWLLPWAPFATPHLPRRLRVARGGAGRLDQTHPGDVPGGHLPHRQIRPGGTHRARRRTQVLNDAWTKIRRAESPRPHVITFVALGGEGKTSLVAKWAAELAHQDWPGCDAAFAWSFYSQGTREQTAGRFLRPVPQGSPHLLRRRRGQGVRRQQRRRVRERTTPRPHRGPAAQPPHPRRPRAAAIRAHLAHAGPAQGPGHRRTAEGPGRRQPRPVRGHHPVFAPGPEGVLADHRAGGACACPAPPACICSSPSA